MNKSGLWNNFKLYIEGKCIEPTDRIRLKFYRAMNIYSKMEKHTPDYIAGYMAGARLDNQSREYINFISDCLNSIPTT